MGFNYPRVISGISKSEAISLMENTDLSDKEGTLYIIKIYYDIQRWTKKFSRLMTLKLKKKNFTAIKVLHF